MDLGLYVPVIEEILLDEERALEPGVVGFDFFDGVEQVLMDRLDKRFKEFAGTEEYKKILEEIKSVDTVVNHIESQLL